MTPQGAFAVLIGVAILLELMPVPFLNFLGFGVACAAVGFAAGGLWQSLTDKEAEPIKAGLTD
jgi:hypothetical protein